jgi:hypothetical protein
MRKHLRSRSLLPCLAALSAAPLAAQTPASIVYTFDHPQLQPARYTITIDENGVGHFASQPGPVDPNSTDEIAPAPMDRDIRIDDSLRATLFSYARGHNFFGAHCDRGAASLAFTGNKTLTYAGSDGHGTCSFIWASDAVLQRLSDQLNAVAFTIEIGRRLDIEVQHDRLGLDSELASLQDAIKDQRASDLPNIATELQAIAGDQDVMDRARKRALALLSHCDNLPKRN